MTAVEVRPALPDGGDADAWWALWRELSPRRTVRVDRGLVHEYVSVPLVELGDMAPAFPYAIYLADSTGVFRLLGFDLDTSRGDVDESCRVLRRLLDDAGVDYVVASSGPGGGRHIWSAWPQGLDPAAVRRLAGALVVLAPALDPGALQNPAAGCVRPVGAPHRDGGRAELVDALPGRAAALLRHGNPPARLQALLAVLPVELRERAAGAPEPADPVVAEAELGARRARLVVDDGGQPRLTGQPRELSADTRRLLYAPLSAGGDASAIAWQCLLRLVFARRSYGFLEQLLDDPRVHGLEYLRTRAGGSGGRVPRPDRGRSESVRQWRKAVDEAVELYRGVLPAADAGLVELVERVERAMDAVDVRRWAGQAGPVDQAVLLAVGLLVLTHNANPVGASVRVVADLAGIGASSAHRALVRLSRPDVLGRAWVAADQPAEGRTAATWRLLDVPADTDAPTAGGSDISSSSGLCLGGTQGNPPPGGFPHMAVDLVARLRFRLDHLRADVWTPRGGLGHHIARTHAALQAGPRSLIDLCWATGYAMRTVLEHVRRLSVLRLVRRDGTTVMATDRLLQEAARDLGVNGTNAARRLRHSVEREVLAWWTAELEWRQARGKQTRRNRRGRRGSRRGPPEPVAGGAQAALPITVGPRTTYGRFPTHTGGPKRGRADFGGAAVVVHAYLTRHPHARRQAA